MTSILLLSDIHANLPALEAVLEDADKSVEFSEVWVLGDTVGYGAQPNEAINLLRSIPHLSMVKGNHEAAAIGEISIYDFNPYAAAAAIWTQQNIEPGIRDFLKSMPLRAVQRGVTLCHGSPRDPIWEYIFTSRTAEMNLQHFDTVGCALGHTHRPTIFGCNDNNTWHTQHAQHNETYNLSFTRWFINPGSVGQPRDEDPRASYALLHLDENMPNSKIKFRRVHYDIDRAQDMIIQAGLPPALAFRLSQGH